MSDSRQVMLLRCANCGNELDGLPEDVVFLCSNCGAGWNLQEELVRVPVIRLSAEGDPAVHLPFWRIEARITITERIVRKKRVATPLDAPRLFSPNQERGLLESPPQDAKRSFIIPGFATRKALSLGVALTRRPPNLPKAESGHFPPIVGGSVGLADAHQLARALVVGEEVARKDMLAKISFEMIDSSFALLSVPSVPEEQGLKICGADLLLRYDFLEDSDAIRSWHRLESDGISVPTQ